MKFFTIAALMSLSLQVFAEKRVEFDEKQEKICHEQAKKAGCVKGTAAPDRACTKAKKSKLTTSCHQIFGIE